VTTTALVDGDGSRVGSKSGSTASWLVFDLLGSVAAIARLVSLVEARGIAPPKLSVCSGGALHAKAAQLAADLIEPSRASALDKLDEGPRGLEIATAWLRSKTASPISGASDPTLEPATR
jgi:hypothetical protein